MAGHPAPLPDIRALKKNKLLLRKPPMHLQWPDFRAGPRMSGPLALFLLLPDLQSPDIRAMPQMSGPSPHHIIEEGLGL